MSKQEIQKYCKLFSLLLLALFIFSCSKDEIIDNTDPEPAPVEVETSQSFIYKKFQENYFWLDQLPDIDPNTYATNDELVDALRYDEIDRWSFVTSLEEYRKLFEQGETKGFGVGMSRTADNHLFTRFTYSNSPMGLAGVDRAWEFLKVNDVDIANIQDLWSVFDTDSPVKFTFKTVEGDIVERTLTRTDYDINTVLHKSIIETNNGKAGYLVFESFLGPSEQELNDAFEYFRNENITDLIIDLRYNGGGSLEIAVQMCELVGGKSILDKVLFGFKYNKNRSDEDESYGIPSNYASGLAVDLNRLFFITTTSSASASELVINSMKPYKDVVLVGDKTHGKPVGMDVFGSEKYQIALAPVTFQLVNASGFGDYFDGIPADYQVPDDIFHSWGDPQEACLKKVLAIINGEADQVATKSALMKPTNAPLKRGLQEITGAY